MSYSVYEPGSDKPYAVFSGGSMLIGGAGRTDLLGPEMTLKLTRDQYHSLLRLLNTLPDSVLVYPTHGAGSFCAATAVSTQRSTTIGQEKLVSPAVQVTNEEEFVQRQIEGYGVYPKYYDYMHDINQGGPRILGTIPDAPALPAQEVQKRMAEGTPLVDGRRRTTFAEEHIPGSLNIELDSSFGTYVGWLLPFNSPLMLLIEDEQGRREAVVQLIRIGYEQVQGYLDGGIRSWKAAALPVESFEHIELDTLYQRWSGPEHLTVVDVRADDEWRDGHIPGSLHFHVGDLPQHIHEVPDDRPLATICRTGHWAEIAASILAATGREVIAVTRGGVPDWINRGWPSTTEDTNTAPVVPLKQSEHAHP
jgi:hydroxyacylglutathione hydrolase